MLAIALLSIPVKLLQETVDCNVTDTTAKGSPPHMSTMLLGVAVLEQKSSLVSTYTPKSVESPLALNPEFHACTIHSQFGFVGLSSEQASTLNLAFVDPDGTVALSSCRNPPRPPLVAPDHNILF